MRLRLLIVCLLTYALGSSQTVLKHEQEIDGLDQFLKTEFEFQNVEDKVNLSGTLIAPTKDYAKIVIIIPGSGKDTRNSHFKLAKQLINNNIAVFRFDERGVGKSGGLYSNTINALTSDVSYAVKLFKSSNTYQEKQIGVLGHSLGGMATIVAHHLTNSSKEKMDFLIQVATPVKSYSEASKYQITTLPHYQIKEKKKEDVFKLLDTLVQITQANKYSGLSDVAIREKGLKAIQNRGFNINDVKFWSYSHIDLYKHDYLGIYKHLNIPTMYLIGSKDKYVDPTSEPQRLLSLNNPLITVKVMKNLNHYLTSGALKVDALYDIDLKASKTIIDWIQKI